MASSARHNPLIRALAWSSGSKRPGSLSISTEMAPHLNAASNKKASVSCAAPNHIDKRLSFHHCGGRAHRLFSQTSNINQSKAFCICFNELHATTATTGIRAFEHYQPTVIASQIAQACLPRCYTRASMAALAR